MNIRATTELKYKPMGRSIQEVIYRACLLLDAEKVPAEWLGLCAPDFKYRITTYSPEYPQADDLVRAGRARTQGDDRAAAQAQYGSRPADADM